MLELDIAICTYGADGPSRVAMMLLPPEEGVRYVVSWQEHGDAVLPEILKDRKDVAVFRLDKKGLSNNRNNAIANCTGDIVLISDDDLEYYPEGIVRIRRAFEDDPGLDVATFRVGFPTPKPYPQDGAKLGVPLPKGYWVTSMEMAFRRDRIGNLRFDPMLGLGAPEMCCGEEELFMVSAIRRGLTARHIGVEICRHPAVTTGGRVSEGILMGQGCVTRVIYPYSGWLRIVLKAWRLHREGKAGFFVSLKWLIRGMFRVRQLSL